MNRLYGSSLSIARGRMGIVTVTTMVPSGLRGLLAGGWVNLVLMEGLR